MSKPKAKPAEPLPEFTSDRMRLLGPLVTDRAIELARHRLIHHKERLSDVKENQDIIRIALLLVREMSPTAHFTNEEEGILRGLSAETVGARKAAGEL